MKEFLRKNAKVIMTVVSIGLMFVFALPAFRNKSDADRSAEAIGSLDGHKVSGDDLANARGELQVLTQMGYLENNRFESAHGILSRIDPELQPIYWIMLNHEAGTYSHSGLSDDAAIQIRAESGKEEADTRREMSAEKLQPGMLGMLVSKLTDVETYVSMMTDMPQPVAMREAVADEALKKVSVVFSPINGTLDWEKAATPTEDRIKAQFDLYKGTIALVPPKPFPRVKEIGTYKFEILDTPENSYKPGGVSAGLSLRITKAGTTIYEGPGDADGVLQKFQLMDAIEFYSALYGTLENVTQQQVQVEPYRVVQRMIAPPALPVEIDHHNYPFGYKYPDRVAVEYLELNKKRIRAAIEAAMTPAEIANDQLKAYTDYKAHPEKKKAPATTASAPATTRAAATQPVDEWKDIYSAQFVEMQREDRVQRQMKRMIEQVLARTQAPWRTSTPDQSQWANYQQIATELSKTVDFSGYVPEYHNTATPDSPLKSREELEALPGIGAANLELPQNVQPFAVLATSVKELVTLEKDNALSRLGLQLGSDGYVLHDADGNAYIYRVSKADKSHEPATIDEDWKPGLKLRDMVVNDVKKRETYEKRTAELKDAVAKSSDIGSIAEQFKAMVHLPDAFTRVQQKNGVLPVDIAGIRGFVEKSFAFPDAPSITPSPKDVMAALNMDETLTSYAIKLSKYTLSKAKDFSDNRQTWLSRFDEKTVPFALKYFDLQSVADRVKYIPEKGHEFKTK